MRPVANLHDIHDEVSVLNGIEDAMGALPNSVLVFTGQFFTAGWAGVIRQLTDVRDHTLTVALLRDGFDLADRRWLDAEAISCHCA